MSSMFNSGTAVSDGPARPKSTNSGNPGFKDEEQGYHKGLSARQIQMIGIGGAIGTGLFMGAGGRLAAAGPGLVLVYAVRGFFAFLILRALGELVLHRPSSGSFVSCAREFSGERAAFTVGWLYWLNWSMIAIVDVTAVALYMNFFKKYVPGIADVPQWLFALAALALVLGLNLVSVKVFGELEFWFSVIKVLALVTFLIVGVCFVAFGTPVAGHSAGFSLISDNGGLFPNGVLPALVVIQGVIFAYGAIELVGTADGETEHPEKVMPKAINAVVFRIGVFYVGSVLLLSCLLPYTAYKAGESPFVTFFGSIGITGGDAIMNLIVLTAALSSLNAGLYSTGRIMRSLSAAGSQIRRTHEQSGRSLRRHPHDSRRRTARSRAKRRRPESAFEIVLNVSSLCLIAAWAAIVLCQLKLWHWARQGKIRRPSFRLSGAPWTGNLTLVFLAVVLVLTAMDCPVGIYTIGSIALIIPLLVLGWFLARGNIRAVAARRGTEGEHAGSHA